MVPPTHPSNAAQHVQALFQRNEESSLRQEVMALIDPYVMPASQPHPFTTEELIVLALVAIADQLVSSDEQILTWICKHFSEHNDSAVRALFDKRHDCHGSKKHRYDDIVDGFSSAFEQYSLPLMRVPELHRRLNADIPFQMASGPRWTTDCRAARMLLDKRLAQARNGTFNFLALPAELRMAIYKYALSYPSLTVDTTSRRAAFIAFHRKLDLVENQTNICFYTMSLDQMLAIAHVNKQIYREALPVFYSINEFDCPSLLALTMFSHMLRRSNPLQSRHKLCGPEPYRAACLTKLSIRLDCRKRSPAAIRVLPNLLAELLQAKELHCVTVQVFDDEWLGEEDDYVYRPHTARRLADSPQELPGIAELVPLLHRARSQEVRGGGGDIERYLTKEVARLKGWAWAEHVESDDDDDDDDY